MKLFLEGVRQAADVVLSLLLFIFGLPYVFYARWGLNPKRPWIGLAVSDRWPDRLEFRRCPYDIAIANAGANVLTFAPHQINQIDQMLDKVDGLVLAGGEDVDSQHYDGDPEMVRSSNPGRDKLELILMKKAVERGLPVLCICRGAQLLAVSAGGTLESHDHDDALMQNHVSTFYRLAKHKIRMEPDSRLCKILGNETSLRVNSFHHQAITDPGSLRVTAVAEDGIIEAVEEPGSRFVVGVQWHPELTAIISRRQQRLFDELVMASRKLH